MNTEEEVNALQQVQDLIDSSIRTNDAKAIDFWHTFKEYIEANSLIKILEELNQPELRNIINSLEGKRDFLERCLNRHDVTYE